MSDATEKQELRLCSGCEWCAVETNSNGEYVCICLCVQSEKYLEPVSLLEDCEAWEAENLLE